MRLRELVDDAELGLVVRAGAAGLDRAVAWVHTSELADPTPFLEGGELLLTTGLALREDACAELVERLVAAGVTGLGFGVGVSRREIPGELVESAERAGLPLIEVPRPTPFIAISKAVSRALAAAEYADLRRTSRAQHELAKAAGSRDGINALVRRLAKLLDAWTVLLDAGGRPIHAAPASTSLRGLEAEVESIRTSKGPSARILTLDDQEVSVQALGARARGVLLAGRSSGFSTADHHLINTAASLLSLALEQGRSFELARRRLTDGLFSLLLRGEDVNEELARLRLQPPAEPFRVVALGGAADDEELWSRLSAEHPEAFLAEHEDAVVGLVEEGEAGWLVRSGPPAGVSEPCRLAGLAEGVRQARQAAAAAGPGDVVRFAELAGNGLLDLLPAGRAAAFAESTLAPLRGHDELLRSLHAWLAHHGQWDPAAARLGVHRHTLRNRIRKAEELLDRRLDQPGVRAELWLALQADRS
ncbi:PucR family transcriptional regulator [Saccharopolyspora griseoalba]|uniref:PucR family transcriptional regulator n=1 Tax=Saccharopolyspora griseoalba TaxID=1431848 RepID=A0ABW2LG59_9PSEU